MPTLYRLKVSLLEPHRPISELHRMIDVRGDLVFEQLQRAIMDYFECDGEYDWQFIIARQRLDNFGKLQTCKEFVAKKELMQLVGDETLHHIDVNFDQLQLELKDYVYLWLMPKDNEGIDLVFRIRIEKISQVANTVASTSLIKSLGKIPIQFKQNIKPDGEFELSLLSALMLIYTGGDGEPVRWQELLDNGVADELVKRKLIKPCVNPNHKVRITAYGESELGRILQNLGIIN